MKYYDENAKSYAASTFGQDFAETVNKGMEHVLLLHPENEAILDIGCGSGRDTFYLTNLGYKVDAFDQSEEMIKQAKSLTNIDGVFNVGAAESFKANKMYHTAYSIACLLHLNDATFIDAVENISAHLYDGGNFYFTVKKGEGEDIDAAGRYFNYYNSDKIHQKMKMLGLFVLDITEQADLTRPDITWLNVWVQKPTQN